MSEQDDADVIEQASALLTEADPLTAGLCRLTGDRPAAACPAFLKNAASLAEGQEGTP